MNWLMSDKYLMSVANKYRVREEIDLFTKLFVINPLMAEIKAWAGPCLNSVNLSGSRAKGTAISLSSDLDLFISLKSDTDNTLKEIFESLNYHFIGRGFKTREQNVSIGVTIAGKRVDLVPAKKRPGHTNDHSIFLRRRGSWTQTNIIKHINKVKNSGVVTEIILLKIWRELHGLSFPSIYLELTAIDALKYRRRNDLANNFLSVLQYLRDEFVDKKVVDPANSNNIISDELFKYEKEAIKKKAAESLSQKYWDDIIW